MRVSCKEKGGKRRDTRKGGGDKRGGGNADKRQAPFSIPSTFHDTGDREMQDEMTLIRLITIIIHLRPAESKGVSRLGAPEKGRAEKEKERRERRKNEKREGRSADITISC